jgi:myo-inositol-1-phosphate synthase
MTQPTIDPDRLKNRPLLMLVAGAKGAVASTLALAVAALRRQPQLVLPSLTTVDSFPYLADTSETVMAGWDSNPESLDASVQYQRIVPEQQCHLYADELRQISIRKAPAAELTLRQQVDVILEDIRGFKETFPQSLPVLIDLLPAAPPSGLANGSDLAEVIRLAGTQRLPDLAYAIAAIQSNVPLVNFSPNEVEIPAIVGASREYRVPIAGRDGKTGQTYLKTVLASAFKERRLTIQGWYSLNILGNEDGRNLMDPDCAAGKVANKTGLLEDILGYDVGERNGSSTHKVHIDYYPPRGDAKEAWDVIDFKGLFDLPMSLRLNLQGRDSILAAPLVLDLSRWMLALQAAGRIGPVSELAFFFKKPVGENPPITFQQQVQRLRQLEKECAPNTGSGSAAN